MTIKSVTMTNKDDKTLSTLVKNNRAGLRALREDHLDILDCLTSKHHGDRNNNCDKKMTPDEDIKERVSAVASSLQLIDTGLADTELMLSLSHYFESFEAERCVTRLEMKRVKDENDWLRDELESTERRLHEALSRLTDLEEEKRKVNFTNEVITTPICGGYISPSCILLEVEVEVFLLLENLETD